VTTRRELEAFLARPWELLRASKDQHNATRDAESLLESADDLRQWANEMGARKTEDARARDLEALVRLTKALDRANAKRSRRAR